MEDFKSLKSSLKLFDIQACFDNDGINGLKRKYGQRNEYLKVDRIIFVCSGDPTSQLPTELMECVNNVAHGVRGKRIFLKILHIDPT